MAMTTPATVRDPRTVLTELYWAAVTAAAPGPALSAALASRTSESTRRIHLLALGKAALPMAEAAVAVLAARGQELAGGLLVTPESADPPHPSLTVAVGDHPQPGAGSLAAADRLGEAVARVAPHDEVWVLLSGGTTSLIGAPVPGLSPADLSELYRLLLGSGLDITAMNRIRKRFARWAGGRLAAALAPAHVKTFTISDVIGDELGSIGSGPCVPDSSSAADVRAALVATNLWERTPVGLRHYVEAVTRGEAPETPKPDHPAFRNSETVLVASNRLALQTIVTRAQTLGLEPHLLDTALAGEAAAVGRRLAATLIGYHATKAPPAQGTPMNKDTILVWGGETTVTLSPDAGRGGRSQELALAAAEVLAQAPATGATLHLLAAGTDGRDGPTDAAGAFADRETWGAIRHAGRDPAADLRQHHSNAGLAAAGALFITGMTGTNVMDVVLGLIRRER
jgi:hydroxypyruvate reductase